jgi:hypothetical protein
MSGFGGLNLIIPQLIIFSAFETPTNKRKVASFGEQPAGPSFLKSRRSIDSSVRRMRNGASCGYREWPDLSEKLCDPSTPPSLIEVLAFYLSFGPLLPLYRYILL